MSNSLRPHRLQHARLPWPSPTPWACSNSYPVSWWCHLTISSSVVPFSSCLQSLPVSGSFLMSQFSTSHSLSYEISQPIKANHTTFHRLTHPLWWPMLSVECVSEQIHFLPITVIRQQEPKFHYCEFWLGWVPAMWVRVPSRVLVQFKSWHMRSSPNMMKHFQHYWISKT